MDNTLTPCYNLNDDMAGSPCFTDWVVKNGMLSEPFVLIDVGVNGGFHPRWKALGEYLHAFGYDPVPSVIDDLKNGPEYGVTCSYHQLVIGDEDKIVPFYVRDNTTSSSVYGSESEENTRVIEIEMVQLDTLYERGDIPLADFVKLDCEGGELRILKGAETYFTKMSCYGFQSESSYRRSDRIPNGHFGDIFSFAIQQKIELFSIINDGSVRPGFANELIARGVEIQSHVGFGQAGTIDALFMTDPVQRKLSAPHYDYFHPDGTTINYSFELPQLDKLIKLLITFELYGLRDCAYEVMDEFKEELGERLDVNRAKKMLLDGIN